MITWLQRAPGKGLREARGAPGVSTQMPARGQRRAPVPRVGRWAVPWGREFAFSLVRLPNPLARVPRRFSSFDGGLAAPVPSRGCPSVCPVGGRCRGVECVRCPFPCLVVVLRGEGLLRFLLLLLIVIPCRDVSCSGLVFSQVPGGCCRRGPSQCPVAAPCGSAGCLSSLSQGSAPRCGCLVSPSRPRTPASRRLWCRSGSPRHPEELSQAAPASVMATMCVLCV